MAAMSSAADGHQFCPLVAIRRARVGQFRGITPPARARVNRMLSPLVDAEHETVPRMVVLPLRLLELCRRVGRER